MIDCLESVVHQRSEIIPMLISNITFKKAVELIIWPIIIHKKPEIVYEEYYRPIIDMENAAKSHY